MGKYEEYLRDRFGPSLSTREQWLYRLRLAAYMGRRGDFDAVSSALEAARRIFSVDPSADIFAYANFAEAMTFFSAGRLEQCLDKLLRADALGVGCSVNDDIRVLIKGWLAHIYRIRGEWQKLECALRQCLEIGAPRSSEAMGRIAVVFADGLQQTAQYHIADAWYALARDSAMLCGDDSVTGAILFNRPSCRVFNERISKISSSGVDANLGMAAMEAASALNYSGYVRDESLPWVFDMLNSQICMLQDDHQRALAHLESPEWRQFKSDWPLVEVLRSTDVLLCKARLGLVTEDKLLCEARSLFEVLAASDDWGDVAIGFNSLREAIKGRSPELEAACSIAVEGAIRRHSESMATESLVFARACQEARNVDLTFLPKMLAKELDRSRIQRRFV